MNGTYFPRRELKRQVRHTIVQFVAPCMMISAAVLLFTLVTYLVQVYSGGLIFPGILDSADFPVRTGIWSVSPDLMTQLGLGEFSAQGGLMAALRVDATALVMVYILPWMQIRPFFITMALVFLVATPIKFGALTQLWNIVSGRKVSLKGLFHWYADLRLTGKSLVLHFVLSVWEWLSQLVCMLPAMALMIFSAQADGDSPIWYAVLILMFGGLLLGYFLSLLFVPVRLMAARDPALSIRAAFAHGSKAFQGHRKEFFFLWLSFLPWHIVSLFTYHAVDLFLFPYQNMSGMLYLTALESRPPEEDRPNPETL
ncbi:MAG: DUF975 family protein [Clostridia bacterium]|nr:DUF975 family protein [Clostridia bacterium]